MDFIEDQALPGTGLAPATFWAGLANLLDRFTPENRALLAKRDDLQAKIDAWHGERRGLPVVQSDYQPFLREIGYLVDEPARVEVTSQNVDPEVARMAGPQLVVPVLNARFLLNAANARWGSLYDALYGTDALPGTAKPGGYDPVRGEQVIARAKAFLDEAVPLASGRHADVCGWRVVDGELEPALRDPAAFAGYRGDPASPDAILLRHHGLGVELVIDRKHPVGKTDPAGLADVDSRIRTDDDCRSGGFDCGGRCSRQGRGLRQLAWRDEGRS